MELIVSRFLKKQPKIKKSSTNNYHFDVYSQYLDCICLLKINLIFIKILIAYYFYNKAYNTTKF